MSAEIDIQNGSFGKTSSEADSLTIDITPYQITYCEMKYDDCKILFTSEYHFDKSSGLTLDEYFLESLRHFNHSKKEFKTVYVNYFTNLFTLCPEAFYDTENARKMLEFNAGNTVENIILIDDITGDIKLIYAIDEKLKSAIDLVFPNHQIKHSLSVLSRLMLQAEELIKCELLLVIHPNHIEIILKKDLKLILANQFSVKTQEDILYYVLFILEQYQLNPNTALVNVAGNIATNSKLIVVLKKYIKHIMLVSGNNRLNWKNIPGMPQHFNYTLVNRTFCE